jgi:hypothetical protein
VVSWAQSESRPEGRVHRDASKVQKAALAVTSALLLEDLAAARQAMDTILELSPPLKPEAAEVVGAEVYTADRVFHSTLTPAREYASKGRLEDAFNEFVWVQRACMNCHKQARAAGLLPADGPLR